MSRSDLLSRRGIQRGEAPLVGESKGGEAPFGGGFFVFFGVPRFPLGAGAFVVASSFFPFGWACPMGFGALGFPIRVPIVFCVVFAPLRFGVVRFAHSPQRESPLINTPCVQTITPWTVGSQLRARVPKILNL